jgi:desulfoferrodoxin (superoxide reductase-like protein)
MNRSLGLMLILLCVVISAFYVNPVFATVPVVDSVTAWTRLSDGHTVLNITITHYGYYSGHYVDWVQINVTGTVKQINLTASSPVDQTVNSTFIVPYDMGVVTDTPTVQARAHCTIHGPSAWSTATQVPEFSPAQSFLTSITMAVGALLLSKGFRSKRRLETSQKPAML